MKNHPFETNLLNIKNLASVREDENYRFRIFLKNKDSEKVDRIVHRLHDEIIERIDCKLCANCCIQFKPRLNRDDLETLSRMEGITTEVYMTKYCEAFEFGAIYLKTIPCRYVSETKCSVYENRPAECRLFPYTRKDDFTSRLYSMIEYYEICPIVFNLMESLKDELKFSR